MSSKKTRTESDRLDHIIAEVRHDRERRENKEWGQVYVCKEWGQVYV